VPLVLHEAGPESEQEETQHTLPPPADTQWPLAHSELLEQGAPGFLSGTESVGVAVGTEVGVAVGTEVGVDVGAAAAGSAVTAAATKSSTSDSRSAASPDVVHPRGMPLPLTSAFSKAVTNLVSAFCKQLARSNDPPDFVYVE